MSELHIPSSPATTPAPGTMAGPEPVVRAGNPSPYAINVPKPQPDEGRDILRRSALVLYRRSGLAHAKVDPAPWFWEGYLCRGTLTLLTGQWKAGKTTLLATLLSRLGGVGTLAGRAVQPAKAVVLSEEEPGPWIRRMVKYGIGEGVEFGFEILGRRIDQKGWERLMEDLTDLHRERRLELLVLDTLGSILPSGAEGHAGAMTNLLRPLRELSWRGVSVLMVHHPRKGSPGYGQKARGTGALSAVADILVEFDWAGPRTAENRRRVLRAWSRNPATPPRLLLELNADGMDYTVLADPELAGPAAGPTRVLVELLADPAGRTARELLAQWPAGERLPAWRTLMKRLAELVDSGWLTRTGRGDRFDPYRYRVA